MDSSERARPPAKEKIPFDPVKFGLNPDENETHQAIVALAEGDLLLAVHEQAVCDIERQYHEGMLPVDKFHTFQDDLFNRIERRRLELGLDERPNYPSS